MAGSLRIDQVAFKFGSSPSTHSLSINPGSVTIFVGPNNSGKSLALREIESLCLTNDYPNRKIIESLEIDFPNDFDSARKLLAQFEVPPNLSNYPTTSIALGQHPFRQLGSQMSVEVQHLKNLFNGQVSEWDRQHFLCIWISTYYAIRLDGRTRFTLTEPKENGDLFGLPRNHLEALLKNDEARAKVQKLTEEAFGLYFLIDPTAMRFYRIRLSSQKPKIEIERGLGVDSLNYFSNALLINEFSDGIQSFVGLASSVLSLPHKIILIDEPEAFLHPPLARRLGRNLALLTKERNATLITATHSAEFLLGCFESITDIEIIRFTYEKGIATTRQLSSEKLTTMTRDPLLRSTGSLRALFHKSVIVTESDTDRAFYDEINHRLLGYNERGIKDALFLNAQNWQTTANITLPLREIGIPSATIVDLDVLDGDDTSWNRLLKACNIPDNELPVFNKRRKEINNIFKVLPVEVGKKPIIKRKGIYDLDAISQEKALALLLDLSNYGLFLVPSGELESWRVHPRVDRED